MAFDIILKINKYCYVFLSFFVFFSLTFSFFVFRPQSVYAQATSQNSSGVEGAATLGVARIVETKEKDLKDGSVLSSSDKGIILSTMEYDPQVIGVVARDAAIVLNSTDESNSVPVISVGK